MARVPEILARAGMHFVIVEHLPQTRIDGACFWLEDGSPVIALSLRYDRIDYVWHTLMHELGHVSAGDGLSNERRRLDTDIVGSHTPSLETKPDFEVAADHFAVNELVPQEALERFIRENRPMYSRRNILALARRINVHPGIVVGQLQYRGEILYSHSRGPSGQGT